MSEDSFRTPAASTRWATSLAVTAFVLAGFTLVTGAAPLTGPAGMIVGLVAHVKGSRLGLPAAILNGVAMIIAMAFMLYLGR